MQPDPDIFVNDDLALEICLAAQRADGPLSAYRLGKETGTHQSSLDRVLRKLTSAGVLHEGTTTRGNQSVKVFDFDAQWAEAIAVFRRRESVGLLRPGGRIILIGSANVEAAARLLRDERYSRFIAWVAEFDDSMFGAAVGLRDDVENSVITALLPELRRLGAGADGAFSLSIGRTFDQPEAGDWTRDILEGPSDSLLSSGS